MGRYGLSGGRVQKLRYMGLKLFIIFYRFVFFTCLQPRHGGGFLENQNLFVGLLIWEATHEPFKEIQYFEHHLFFLASTEVIATFDVLIDCSPIAVSIDTTKKYSKEEDTVQNNLKNNCSCLTHEHPEMGLINLFFFLHSN